MLNGNPGRLHCMVLLWGNPAKAQHYYLNPAWESTNKVRKVTPQEDFTFGVCSCSKDLQNTCATRVLDVVEGS